MILLTEDSIFVDPDTGETHDLHNIPENLNNLIPMEYYVVGSHVYQFIGPCSSSKSAPIGSIFTMNGSIRIKEYETDEEKLRFGEDNVTSRKEYESIMTWNKSDMEKVAQSYIDEHDTNLMEINRSKLVNTGDVFVPELKDTDDPMERVIKLIVLNMKLKLNERRGSFDKEYGLDNLRSALNGATKNMSILKFLMWCELLNLDWEFCVINSDDGVPHPLKEPVIISNKIGLTDHIPENIPKGIFGVPLIEGEDPLKRLVKVAIWRKQFNLKDYKHKGTTSHLINNMRSALKGKQKMSIPCTLNWCEILDLILIIKVTNPENGVWYKCVGYDVYTNAVGDENAIYVEEKG